MPVEHWDVWFVYIIGNRLDADSRKIWESELSTKDREIVTNATGNIEDIDPIDRFPKFSDFADFLEKRAQALSMIAADKNTRKSDARNQTNSSERNLRKVFHVKSYQQNKNIYSKCRICAGPHNVFKCSKFLSKTPYERSVEMRRLHLCPNCLGAHQINRCNSNSTCFTCKGKHHTLLHFKTSIPSAPIDTSNNSSDSRSASAKALTANISATSCSIVLATAQIVLIGPSGLETRARALLDQESETSFVSESIAQLLKLPKQRVEISLSGLGACNAVLNKLTTHTPARKITSLNKEELKSLPLADPEFYESHVIDIILGADVYGQLLRTGLQRFITSNLTAQNTVLGWILSGSLDTSTPRRADKFGKISKTVLHCAADEQLQNFLQRFWLLEEVPPLTNKFNPEENNCEKHFVETHARTPDGRFVVRLPFKLEPPHKGDESRNIALKSLVSIHKRFSRDKRLAESYRDFMTNYKHLGHMSRIPENEIKNPRAWYIPHHAVVDLLNENKKLRVVFDASRKLSDNDSLNKFLNTGPSLQQDLSLILLNWRKYEFVFTTDIVKMFRQILVDKSDQDFQRILWSPSSEGTPIEYRLETVTYGTTCAPFLAIRTLLQLAQDERSRYPLGARCLEYNTYVDDTFAGDNDLGIAIKKRNELVQILGSAGITLDKWASNHNDLLPNKIWWHGPAWLSEPSEHWPQANEKPRVLHSYVQSQEPEILQRFSTLSRLIRVVAYCLRPLLRLRRQKENKPKLPNFLTASELADSRRILIRIVQENAFADEIAILKSRKALPKRHPLCKINPFYDKNSQLLRAGGRLSNANVSQDHKHPAILPYRSFLSKIFVQFAHKSSLHGGPTLTAGILLQSVWVVGRTKIVKSVIRNCVVCQRVKPRLAHQLMDDLPSKRVTPARPFSTSGLDYAGPIQIRTTKGRGHKSYKGYIVLFVCFSTRALHLELVSDLTSTSFIAAYRHFVSRRGICNNIYSDNASTFHGADKELRAMFNAASKFYTDTAETLANDGTNWTFIPPNAPHYGGLWEAGVKSVKHHLKRVIGEHTLTFEELSTLLAEIEACLNSRPLCPLSTDTDDLQALTPAHFLVCGNLALIPDKEEPSGSETRLSRFQLLQRLRNQFWKRWSLEYLSLLQERNKWRDPNDNFTIGQLVTIRDDRYPPSKWPLGRIIEVHPGPDGIVRVVTLKTATTTLRRHIARLSPLYMDNN